MTSDQDEFNQTAELSSTELHSSTYNVFILVLTIFSLGIMLLLLLPRLSTETKTTLQFIDTMICIIFLGDFISSLRRAPDNRAYFLHQGGWLDLLGSVPAIPGLRWTAILRLARLGRLARIIRFLRAKDSQEIWADFKANRAQSALLITAFTAIIVITIAAVVVLQVETRSEDANIQTGGDAFWWALVSVTTVGYGDQYPVSGLGRLVALPLMIIGVGIFGVLTSYLSHAFIAPEDDNEDTVMDAVVLQADMAHLKSELETIKELLKELKE